MFSCFFLSVLSQELRINRNFKLYGSISYMLEYDYAKSKMN